LCLSAVILLDAEPKYQSFPTYVEPGPPRQMAIVLTFRRPPPDAPDAPEAPEAPEGGEGEDAPAPVSTADKDVTIMTVQLSAKDSVNSLNRRIRKEVYRLKKLAAAAAAAAEGGAAAEGDDEAPAVVAAEGAPSVNAVLPDAATLEPLVSLIYETLARSLQSPEERASGAPLRQIAHDGLLWNFPFPEELKIEMIVG
jgi:hypothetical protein